MNEEQWLACGDDDYRLMLHHLGLRMSDRKWRLFACAVCRLHWDLFADDLTRETVALVQKLADGMVSANVPRRRAFEARTKVGGATPAVLAAEACAGDEAFLAACNTCHELAVGPYQRFILVRRTHRSEGRGPIPRLRVISTALIRHIFGNPFRPYPASASWPSSVVQLASAMYEGQSCSFALHDSLLETGHTELAEHFQKTEWHPKGCWALDVILGKT
jgi:hypothetical protein